MPLTIFLGNRAVNPKILTNLLLTTMPPCRRTRKVGLKRIDAALDALRPMGFPDHLVRSTVRTLLKAYGGDDGWMFVEEASYKLVIETILEGLENSERMAIENCSSKDDIMEDEPGVQVPSLPAHSMQIESSGIRSPPPPAIRPCSLNDDAVPGKLALLVHSPQNDSAPNHSPDINSLALADIIPCSKDETSLDNLGRLFPSPQISLADVHSPCMYSPPLMDSLPYLRRKPCYGWISSDEEEDLVYTTPAT